MPGKNDGSQNLKEGGEQSFIDSEQDPLFYEGGGKEGKVKK